ncbi:uncharacterized protein KY384_008239 [Bacidia gigantensis]|uniref:uncharacterized protein n=1 Tax=Bacidia gigantensis TaxID=2732470 RepID=UPI001D050BC6|nr:uncharacterized protein KY384_008239 [Bacidia gigantensis]KAG8526810.1 hypothetical protein KY384_008239 [Bacidia gigantensis]
MWEINGFDSFELNKGLNKLHEAYMANVRLIERSSEEWEEWMDWDQVSEIGPQEKQNLALKSPNDKNHHSCSAHSGVESDRSRKRKSSIGSCEVSTSPKRQSMEKATAQNKSHSLVEKRYRNNLNQRIAELEIRLPNLRDNSRAKAWPDESPPIPKHNKAIVLTEAISYIDQLERQNKYLQQENTALQLQMKGRDAKSTSHQEVAAMSETPLSRGEDVSTGQDVGLKVAALSEPVQGLIKVPEEWRRLWRGELKPYSPNEGQNNNENERDSAENNLSQSKGGRNIRRLVVGSIAGLTLVNGLNGSRKDHSNMRGLFGLPLIHRMARLPRNFSSVTSSPFHLSSGLAGDCNLLQVFLRAALLFAVLGLLLFIYLFTSRPPSRKTSTTSTDVSAISPASPLEVRQRAFLTALQTIWVPRHHVLPEMLALNIETAAYIIRQLLGWQMYSWATGRSEEEEIARVRAWDICIDAQLSGGDTEVSRSRLVLSLWASGTLPKSPARLMLKALHIRILFWQPSRWKWLTDLLHCAARKLAQWQWSRAQALQQKLDEDCQAETRNEPLTEHLRAILPLASEDVLDDAIVQRAHNLAWNTSTSQRDCGESMTEDNVMRGPLDALASWYSNSLLTEILRSIVQQERNEELIKDTQYQLELAVISAPSGSLPKARALAAESVLVEADRDAALKQLKETLSPAACFKKGFTTRQGPQIDSLVKEVPFPDANDIALCVELATMLEKLQFPEHPNIDLSETVDQLLNHKTGMQARGLLGWTTLSQAIIQTYKVGYGHQLRPLVEQSVKQLKESKGIDLQIRNHLNLVLTEIATGVALDEVSSRRYSGTSNDT